MFNFETFTNRNAINFYNELGKLMEALAAEDDESTPMPMLQPAVTTAITEEGRIAYMNIVRFRMNSDERYLYGNIALDFYKEIQDYDHLIIDIRENSGGGWFWTTYIMRALAADDVQSIPMYAFFLDTDFSRACLH